MRSSLFSRSVTRYGCNDAFCHATNLARSLYARASVEPNIHRANIPPANLIHRFHSASKSSALSTGTHQHSTYASWMSANSAPSISSSSPLTSAFNFNWNQFHELTRELASLEWFCRISPSIVRLQYLQRTSNSSISELLSRSVIDDDLGPLVSFLNGLVPLKQRMSQQKFASVGPCAGEPVWDSGGILSVSTLAGLREAGAYVDKTKQLGAIIEAPSAQYIFLRPRRWGKSLLLDSLAQYFYGHHAVFQGLALGNQLGEQLQCLKCHPVVLLEFNQDIPSQLNAIASSFSLSLPVDIALQDQFKWLLQELNRIFLVAQLLQPERFSSELVILWDEYDSVCHHLMLESSGTSAKIEQNLLMLRDFGAIVKSLKQLTRLFFVTGITRLSLLSGMNQFADITNAGRFADLLGFTWEQIRLTYPNRVQLLADVVHRDVQQQGSNAEPDLVGVYSQIEHTFNSKSDSEITPEQKVACLHTITKHRFNGFRFSLEAALLLYCPFDIMNILCQLHLRSAWTQSGSNSALAKLLQARLSELPKLLMSPLAAREFFDAKIDALAPIKKWPVAMLARFFMDLGYLTFPPESSSSTALIRLQMSNDSIKRLVFNAIVPADSEASDKSVLAYNHLRQGNIRDAYLEFDAMLASLPCHSAYVALLCPFGHTNISRYQLCFFQWKIFSSLQFILDVFKQKVSTFEAFFQLLMTWTLHRMMPLREVQAELSGRDGRSDLVIFPFRQIHEFKLLRQKQPSQTGAREEARNAIGQTISKNYMHVFTDVSKSSPITLVGVVFTRSGRLAAVSWCKLDSERTSVDLSRLQIESWVAELPSASKRAGAKQGANKKKRQPPKKSRGGYGTDGGASAEPGPSQT